MAPGPQYSGATKVTGPVPTLTPDAATVLADGVLILRTWATGNILAEYVASRCPQADRVLDSSLRGPRWVPQYCGSVPFGQSLMHHV